MSVSHFVKAAILTGGSVILFLSSLGGAHDLMQTLSSAAGLTLVGLSASFGLSPYVMRRLRRADAVSLRRILVLGDEEQAAPYLEAVRRSLGLVHVVGYLPFARAKVAANGASQGYDLAEVEYALDELAADEVVLAEPAFPEVELAELCCARGIAFHTLVRLPVSMAGRCRARVLEPGQFLLTHEAVPRRPLRATIKRVLDIVGATLGLVISLVILPLVLFRIRRETGGSAFFQQVRIGKNGRRFTLFKLRSMYVDAEQRLSSLMDSNEMTGPIFKMRDDPRITPLGQILRKYHLDEFPQFWNVLCGEMSLVGTRPPTPSEVARYSTSQRRRLAMKPGLTGLWQVEGNSAISDFNEIVRLDCRYIDNWSLLLDTKIILRTLKAIFHGSSY